MEFLLFLIAPFAMYFVLKSCHRPSNLEIVKAWHEKMREDYKLRQAEALYIQKNKKTTDEQFMRFLELLRFSFRERQVYNHHLKLFRDNNHSVINNIPEVLKSFEKMTSEQRTSMRNHVREVFNREIKIKENTRRATTDLDIETFRTVLSSYVPEDEVKAIEDAGTTEDFFSEKSIGYYNDGTYSMVYNGISVSIPLGVSTEEARNTLASIYPELRGMTMVPRGREIHFEHKH